MSQLPKLSIFISSPTDVNPEREVAKRVVYRLAREFSSHFAIEPLLWEREPLIATEHFQTMITPPSATDITVVILWSRLGTFLPTEGFYGAVTGKRPVTGTEWEFEQAVHAYQQGGKPDVLLYRKEAKIEIFSSLTNKNEGEEKLKQLSMLQEFLNEWFIDVAQGTYKAAHNVFTDAGQFEEMLEIHLRALLKKKLNTILEERKFLQFEINWHQGSPYRGLKSFELEHAPIFFGRTKECHELRDNLIKQINRGCAFLLVFGASGCGKSSLVRAGLLSDLKVPGMVEKVGLVRHAVMRPSDTSNLIVSLATALLSDSAFPELTRLQYDIESICQVLHSGQHQIALIIRQGLACATESIELINDAQVRLVLVIDQLEELFTQKCFTQYEREDFVHILQIFAKSQLVWVVATLRSDFLDQLDTFPELMAMSQGDGGYLLSSPNIASISQIIRRPAQEAGLRFDIAQKTGIALDDVLLEKAAKNKSSLPLLEFTLHQLWLNRENNGLLTYSAYERFGGMEGAISNIAEQIIKSFGDDAHHVFVKVLRRLVSIDVLDGGRVAARWAAINRFLPGSRELELVNTMLSNTARLLVAEGNDKDKQIRFTHEALLTHWDRAKLQIEKDRIDLQIRDRLEQAAKRWQCAEKTQQQSLLLPSGTQLQEGQGLLHRWQEELDIELVNFILASVSAYRKHKQKQIGILLGGGLSVPLLYCIWLVSSSFIGVQQVESDIKLVSIPQGCFKIGSSTTELDHQDDEKPQHDVCINSYQLSQYEITQRQWQKVMLDAPSATGYGIGDNYPVNMVSWYDISKFIQLMNLFGKHHYRLPTEAEWEYATRAGSNTARFWSDDEKEACFYANVLDEQIKKLAGKSVGAWFSCDDNYGYSSSPVGSYRQNQYGVYDMLGNVWEWTCSSYNLTGYDGNETICVDDAEKPLVVRGGSWNSGPINIRSALRGTFIPSHRSSDLGFRIVMER